jgi:hypothetical protein
MFDGHWSIPFGERGARAVCSLDASSRSRERDDMLAVLLAAHLAASPPPAHFKKKRRPTTKRSLSTRADRELQIALLARRHAMLHDFLVEIGTEKPALRDPRVVEFPGGIRVGPSSVDIDFLGSPIVRARITNASGAVIDVLITVTLGPQSAGTAADVERLAPGESRVVELMGAIGAQPSHLEFSIQRL